jgi:hypothetical protein
MKNKILALILSAVLLLASFTLSIYASEDDIFSISGASETVTLEMKEISLHEETKKYINDNLFDGLFYDASIYGAYTASLKDGNISAEFTSDMSITINIGDEHSDTEVFVFGLIPNPEKNSFSPTRIIEGERDGANLVINGEDFAEISDVTIVVMTSNKPLMTGPEFTWIPAAVCGGVALLAIVISIVLVKKKNKRNVITG